MNSRVALVTGAASGIGRATAELFVERGAHVVGFDVDEAGLKSLHGVTPVVGDVSVEEDNLRAVATAVERYGRLDSVVLNAGFGGAGPIEGEEAIPRLERILAVSVTGAALGVRAAVPALRAAGGGSIVAVSSVSGLRGDPGTWAYNAAKAAVVNMVRGTALDYARENIRVNAVAPGLTDTPLTDLHADPQASALLADRIPLGRWAAAREQAEAIWFLSSPAASYITGATLAVDGGLSANNGLLFASGKRR